MRDSDGCDGEEKDRKTKMEVNGQHEYSRHLLLLLTGVGRCTSVFSVFQVSSTTHRTKYFPDGRGEITL